MKWKLFIMNTKLFKYFKIINIKTISLTFLESSGWLWEEAFQHFPPNPTIILHFPPNPTIILHFPPNPTIILYFPPNPTIILYFHLNPTVRQSFVRFYLNFAYFIAKVESPPVDIEDGLTDEFLTPPEFMGDKGDKTTFMDANKRLIHVF